MRSRTSTWFETKVKYQKTMEDGSEKVVSEAYVVDALSFTEAESAIIDEMSVYVSGELKVSGIGKACYGESSSAMWMMMISGIRLNSSSSQLMRRVRRRSAAMLPILFRLKSLARALRYIDEVMGKTMIDYDVVGLNETKLMDVFEHHAPNEKKEEKNDVPEYEEQK